MTMKQGLQLYKIIFSLLWTSLLSNNRYVKVMENILSSHFFLLGFWPLNYCEKYLQTDDNTRIIRKEITVYVCYA